MSEQEVDLWPGQVDRIDFTLEHVRCLASVARSEVFWSISISNPMSIAEIAAALDRPANTTTYHVNELLAAGLLISTGERKAKTRVERLFVRSARSFFHQAAGTSKEYRSLFVEGLLSLMRSMGRQIEATNEVYDFEPEISDFRIVRRYNFKISRERSREFKREVSAMMRRYALEEDKEGVRISAVMFIAPTLAESRKRLRAQKKS